MSKVEWAVGAPSIIEQHNYHLPTPNQAMFESFLDFLPDATLLANEADEIISVNSRTEAMFGFSRKELIGQPVEVLVAKPTRERPERWLGNSHVHSRTLPMALPLDLNGRRKDGSEFPIDIVLSPLPEGYAAATIAVIRDISARQLDRKRTEAAIMEVQHCLLASEENERQRLAQELHDGPLQTLHSLDFELVAMSRQVKDGNDQAQLLEMRFRLRQVARELRAICQDLRPPALTPFGVSAVIRSFTDAIQELYPTLELELELANDEQSLPDRVRITLYRICQHALRNVVRHASASHVIISLQLTKDQVELRVEDDGCGFVLPDDWLDMARQGKFGLIGCVERAEAIGGQFTIVSAPGNGTQIYVSAPYIT